MTNLPKYQTGDRVGFKKDPEIIGEVTALQYIPIVHSEPVYRVIAQRSENWFTESDLISPATPRKF